MTQAQLLTLAEQYQAAHQTGGHRPAAPSQSGPGLLEMAAMQ